MKSAANQLSPVSIPGRLVTQKYLSRSMNLNIIAGCMGSMWFAVCSPQPIFNVFLKNALGITSTEMGLLLMTAQFMSVFHLLEIFIYGNMKKRKPFVIGSHIVQRIFGFVLSGVALLAASGQDKRSGFWILFFAMVIAWIAWNICSSGWWSWMADLFPDSIRGSFFGRRSSIIMTVNIIWGFLANLALDLFAGNLIFYVYAVIFALAGVLGIMDLVLHGFIPEPSTEQQKASITMKEFLEPVKDKNFISFAIIIGLSLFSINIFAPFSSPYLTSKDYIGAPNTWLGISTVIFQLSWIAAASLMGLMMDRFGRKPVVILGGLMVLTWTGYYFMTPGNFMFLIPIMSLVSGLLSSGYWEGQNQMMLSLTPEKNRTAYIAWYQALTGMIASSGSYVGGFIEDLTKSIKIPIYGDLNFGAFQIILTISLALSLTSFSLLSRIKEKKGRGLTYVLNRFINPDFLRTYMNMAVISGSPHSEKTAKALRSIDGPVSDLALKEVTNRLDDPDFEVRTEAARALGRMGAVHAVEDLIRRLKENSSIRCQAAWALGKIGDLAAVPYLVEGLSSDSVDFQEACANALGDICSEHPTGIDDSIQKLLEFFQESRPERLAASGAETVSRIGLLDAAFEIFPRIHTTLNPVLRGQLGIAMGNLLGEPGEFYQYVSGTSDQRRTRIEHLFLKADKNVTHLCRKMSCDIDAEGLNEYQILLGEIKDAFDSENYPLALKTIIKTGEHFLSMIFGKEISRKDFLDQALAEDQKLALWSWFLQELEKFSGLDYPQDPETLRIDILLGVYFLSRVEVR